MIKCEKIKNKASAKKAPLGRGREVLAPFGWPNAPSTAWFPQAGALGQTEGMAGYGPMRKKHYSIGAEGLDPFGWPSVPPAPVSPLGQAEGVTRCDPKRGSKIHGLGPHSVLPRQS